MFTHQPPRSLDDIMTKNIFSTDDSTEKLHRCFKNYTNTLETTNYDNIESSMAPTKPGFKETKKPVREC